MPTPQSAATQATALLAEDDEMIRDIVAQYLEALGYRVLLAKDGKAAIDIVRQTGPLGLDLLVTDLLMPHASGDKVVKAAREQGVCEHFLVISGFALNGYDTAVTPDEHLAYLEKPFNFQAFEAKVDRLLHHAV